MRILQISSARSIGGGERHVADLSNEMVKRGHDIFAALAPGSPLRSELAEVPSTNILEFPLRNALDISTAVKIGKLARDNRIELINAHFAKDYPVAAAAARIGRIPFVITRHVLFPMHRLHAVFLRAVEYVIAPSNAVAEALRSQGIFPPGKIVTIRYALDIDKFPERVRAPHAHPCIGAVGNLDRVKGFDILIKAARIVAKHKPDVKFKIVGEDRSRDRENEKKLRGLIAELNLGMTVDLAGWSNQVSDVLADLDIFVSSSRSESFGFVIAEAMLTGVPVIATETEGAKEIISDGSLGLLVPIGSPESLANAIRELLDDPERQNHFSKRGRNHIEEHFSLGRMVDETEKLYKRVIEPR